MLEVGAGWNTPTVTRFVAEAVARAAGAGGSMVRVNPEDPEVPLDVARAAELGGGWGVLAEILASGGAAGEGVAEAEDAEAAEARAAAARFARPRCSQDDGEDAVDWRRLLANLRR